MTESEFRKFVGSKISFYRKANNMTQSSLAEKINYSDKAVSKWERGESLPDTYILVKIAHIFDVTVNELTGMNSSLTEEESLLSQKAKQKKIKQIMTASLSTGLVWLIVSFIYFITNIIVNDIFAINYPYLWILFVYAFPVSFIVLHIFSCLWGRIWHRAATASSLLCTIVSSVLISFSVNNFAVTNKYYIFIAAGFFQILIVLWFVKRKLLTKN